jgi:hypothetical protein
LFFQLLHVLKWGLLFDERRDLLLVTPPLLALLLGTNLSTHWQLLHSPTLNNISETGLCPHLVKKTYSVRPNQLAGDRH